MAYAAPLAPHTMKNTAAVARRSRGVHGGLASVKPPDATKAYHHIHLERLSSHLFNSFPDRVLASDQNIPLLSYIRKLTQKGFAAQMER